MLIHSAKAITFALILALAGFGQQATINNCVAANQAADNPGVPTCGDKMAVQADFSHRYGNLFSTHRHGGSLVAVPQLAPVQASVTVTVSRDSVSGCDKLFAQSVKGLPWDGTRVSFGRIFTFPVRSTVTTNGIPVVTTTYQSVFVPYTVLDLIPPISGPAPANWFMGQTNFETFCPSSLTENPATSTFAVMVTPPTGNVAPGGPGPTSSSVTVDKSGNVITTNVTAATQMSTGDIIVEGTGFTGDVFAFVMSADGGQTPVTAYVDSDSKAVVTGAPLGLPINFLANGRTSLVIAQ